MAQDEWDRIRKQTYRNACYECEVCGKEGPKWPVECHEIWEYDDENHIQTLKGLVALCTACHQVKHIGYAQVKGKFEEAKKHLAKVNGWSNNKAESYIRKQFKVWKDRSDHEWKVDCEWIKTIKEI